MKTLAKIFCVIILLMSAMPSLQHVITYNKAVAPCEKSCCKKSKDDNKSNQACKGTCNNPFMSCCGFCTLLSNEIPLFSNSFFVKVKFGTYADKLFISFYSSAWHPPQMV